MGKCTKAHLRREGNRVVVDPHEYIAGICLLRVSLGTRSFLEYTYPDYYSRDYKKSTRRHIQSEVGTKRRDTRA